MNEMTKNVDMKDNCQMHENKNSMEEMRKLRSEMKQLRSIIADQQIVNNRIIRRGINSDLSREKKDIIFSIIAGVFTIFSSLIIFPKLNIPIWFTIYTIIFMLIAIIASIYTIMKHMNTDTVEESMLCMAEKIVSYRKFQNNWYKFSIPMLGIWFCLFFYALSNCASGYRLREMILSTVLGIVIGSIIATIKICISKNRIKRMLSQIEEMKQE